MPISPTSCASTRIASGYSARSLLGRHYLQHLRAFLGEDLQGTGFIATQDALAAGVLQRLGIAWRPASGPHGRLPKPPGAVSAPLVQDGEVSPWRGLEPNYIAALLAQPQHRSADRRRGPIRLAHAGRQPAAAPAAPRAAARTRRRRAHRAARRAPTSRRSCAMPSSSISSPINRRRHRRRRGRGSSICRRPASPAIRPSAVPRRADHVRHAGHGRARRFPPQPHLLKDRDSETLQYLMQGTLDLSSHRLDAWITSFATKRLAHDDGRRPARRLCGRLRLGREPQAHAGLVRHRRDHAAGRRERRRWSRATTTPASSTRRR